MKLLIFGDLSGSGGYRYYCKGLFCSNNWNKNINTTFICSSEFAHKLRPLDPTIKLFHNSWLESNNRFKRYFYHICIYPYILMKTAPDIEFYPSGNLRAFFRKPICVTVCHNLLPFDTNEINYCSHSRRRYFLNLRKRQAKNFQNSHGVIFISEHSRDVVTSQFPSIKNSIVIPHGLDEKFKRNNSRSYALTNEVRLLYISPIFHYKHQVELVGAVKKLRTLTNKNINLRLVGGGFKEDVQKLFDTINECNAHSFCTVLPFIGKEDVITELNSANIFVFASSCETFGSTLLEAMGMRLPIACSNKTGLKSILKDAGLYFDPFNIDSISDALHILINNNKIRECIGEMAYRYSLNYSWSRCANETTQFINYIYKKYAKEKCIHEY